MAKKSIQPKIKEPVRLRSKKLADGSESLYLDIYRDGRRSYEFLKLYIHPETGPQIKTLNSETMKAANTIKMERILEITHNEAGLKHYQNYLLLWHPIYYWSVWYLDMLEEKKTIKRENRETSGKQISCLSEV